MTQLSCLGWPIGSAYAKRHKRDENLFAATAVQITFGGAILMAVATITGQWAHVQPTQPTWRRRWTVFRRRRHVCRIRLLRVTLKHLPVSIVSLYAYVNPVIAVILGSLI